MTPHASEEHLFDLVPTLSHTAQTEAGRLFTPDRVVVNAYGPTPETLGILSIHMLGSDVEGSDVSSLILHCNDPHFPFPAGGPLVPAWVMLLLEQTTHAHLVPSGQAEQTGAFAPLIVRHKVTTKATSEQRIPITPSPKRQLKDRITGELFSPYLAIVSQSGETPDTLTKLTVCAIGKGHGNSLARTDLPDFDLPKWLRNVVTSNVSQSA